MKKIKLTFVALCMLAVGSLLMSSCVQTPRATDSASAEPNTLTAQEESEGWRLLFDGESVDGWRNYGKSTFPEGGWVIEDGTLHLKGHGTGEAGGEGGDIIYDQPFKDFHLKLDWKISDGGNSGIFYLAQELEGEPIWKSAPEMQILDNDRHIDAGLGVDGNRKAGSLYDLIPAKPQNANPAGEWNSAEVTVYRGTVVHRMNGQVVLEYHLGTSDWNRMIENSKFATFTEFAKASTGYIGLQDHGDDVWFRNIKVREL
jgi:hypothetical protein